MKRFLTLIFSMMLMVLFVGPMPIQAATSHVIDDADLLTSEEERELD